MDRMDLIQVHGKSTRGLQEVFIPLTPNMTKIIQYLISTRHAGPDNRYVFGRRAALNITFRV